ncbi:MAG: MFS transporter [Actinomycetota bacterium]|nr:MFS transporter [Actinomycetota bacterium]
MSNSSPPGQKSSTLSVWAWAIYDFSNTIFAVSILTVYFPLWISEQISGSGAWLVNSASAFAALLVLLTAPALGSIADFRQRRIPYLIFFTLVSVVLTAALGISGGVVIGVALFIAADLAYQSALVFYNALLPAVARGRGAGKVSGYGTAVGYFGSIFALLTLGVVIAQSDAIRDFLGFLGAWMLPGEATQNAFIPTAVLYLVFSLPAFFLVPDPKLREPRPVSIISAYRGVISTVRNIRGYAGMGTFMIATLLYTDAANTAVTNTALYANEVFGMAGSEVTTLILFSTIFAIVGSFAFGFATDRFGPKRTLMTVLFLWLVAILATTFALGPWMLYLVGPIVGVALGATWTVSRPMLIALSPPEKLGEFFGIFTFAGKVSAVIGPAITAAILLSLGDLGTLAYRIAIGNLAVLMIFAIFFMSRVPDVRPDPETEAAADDIMAGGEGDTRKDEE